MGESPTPVTLDDLRHRPRRGQHERDFGGVEEEVRGDGYG